MSGWRLTVIGLLLVNVALLTARALAPPPEPPPEPPPPPPDVPEAQLVAEAFVRASASRPRCYTIGPLTTRVQQSRAEDRLRPFASRIQVRATAADRDLGWWVYVPGRDRAAAIRIARAMGEAGVEDYFVVADPDLPEAVSVGLFERLETARSRRAGLRRAGFEAEVSARRERVEHYWIDYQIDPGQRSPWRMVLRAAPTARQIEIPCF